jgi:hypothetical protein
MLFGLDRTSNTSAMSAEVLFVEGPLQTRGGLRPRPLEGLEDVARVLGRPWGRC